jgi:Mg-chelatase subunit ChlD
MNWLSLAFDRPQFLVLLGLLPALWYVGRGSLRSLAPLQAWLAVFLRTAVALLLILALADVQLVRITDRLAAIFVVDQSASVEPDDRTAIFDYIRSAVGSHRQPQRDDAAGVIVFGREAQVEHPPLGQGELPPRSESSVDPERTNLGDALKLAKATFPPNAARRVVVISDGNQNLGDALNQARDLSAAGISIDVAPLAFRVAPDIIVSKVATPSDARAGVPFDVSVVVENYSPATTRPRAVAGRLVVSRKVDGTPQLVADQPLVVAPGKQVFRFEQQLDEAAFYTYEARFVPDDTALDRHSENNLAASFTQIRGKGRVLFIVNSENPTEFDHLVGVLRRHEIEVTVQSTDALFGSLQELQNFDCVVLANVPRTSGVGGSALVQFSDEQVDMLVRNVEQFGAGLVMLGGPDSFGAGGWANTALEKAMPVDFQIRNAKVKAVGALMLVIDRSGSMSGPKLEMSKAAAKQAAKMLGPSDHIGVIAFDTEAQDIVRLQRVGDRPHRVQAMIDRMDSGGGTNMEPAVRRGYAALQRVNASVKHMIVLTDGQTNGSGYEQLASRMRKENITTTAVAVGTDAARTLLQNIASRGGGKYYQAISPRALPGIFTNETRRVVRPLILEDPAGLPPQLVGSHEILAGVEEGIPPITGYVMTEVKENPLVEVPLVAPRPGHPNNSLLAAWTYGLGRTVCLTTDAGQRWTKDWSAWPGYDQMFTQMIRYAMRPIAEEGDFTLATDLKDGRLQVVVQALTAEGDIRSGLVLDGSVVSDSGQVGADLAFKEVGPGRYVAEAPLDAAGTHLVAVRTGPRQPILRSGVNVPFSPEFRDREANETLLQALASMTPPGGQRGEIIRLPEQNRDWGRWPGPNVFRRDLPKPQLLTSIWPAVVLITAGVFLCDIANRRLLIPWGIWKSAGQWLVGRPQREQSSDARLERLKARKRAAATPSLAEERFNWESSTAASSLTSSLTGEPTNSIPASIPAAGEAPSAAAPDSPPTMDVPPEQDETYSGRLLKAVRSARRDGK